MKQETVARPDAGKRMGVLMIFVGAIFLMGTSGITFAGHSPWMLMALVPVYWIAMSAYGQYKEDGRLTRRVLSIAVFAVLPLAYMITMALGSSISGLWPLGVIVVGVSFLLLGSRK